MLDLANGRMATLIRRRILSGFIRRMRENPDYEPPLTPDMLKLLKDSEDRAFGGPTKNVNFEGKMQFQTLDVSRMPTELLEQLLEIADGTQQQEEGGFEVDAVDAKTGERIRAVVESDDDLDLDDEALA